MSSEYFQVLYLIVAVISKSLSITFIRLVMMISLFDKF